MVEKPHDSWEAPQHDLGTCFSGYQVLVIGGTRGDGHAIATSFADAGASVTVTGTMMLVRAWLELSMTPESAQAELIESTQRAGDNWAGLGVRVAGDTLIRTRHEQPLRDAVTDAALFMRDGLANHRSHAAPGVTRRGDER